MGVVGRILQNMLLESHGDLGLNGLSAAAVIVSAPILDEFVQEGEPVVVLLFNPGNAHGVGGFEKLFLFVSAEVCHVKFENRALLVDNRVSVLLPRVGLCPHSNPNCVILL